MDGGAEAEDGSMAVGENVAEDAMAVDDNPGDGVME
jgi:hypothetical protein